MKKLNKVLTVIATVLFCITLVAGVIFTVVTLSKHSETKKAIAKEVIENADDGLFEYVRMGYLVDDKTRGNHRDQYTIYKDRATDLLYIEVIRQNGYGSRSFTRYYDDHQREMLRYLEDELREAQLRYYELKNRFETVMGEDYEDL